MEKQYIYKRLALLPIIWVTIIVTHTLLYYWLPDSPSSWLYMPNLNYNEQINLYLPNNSMYDYLKQALWLNFGESLFHKQDCFSLILSHLPLSLKMTFSAFILLYSSSLVLGYALFKKHPLAQSTQNLFKSISSIPSFLLYTLVFLLAQRIMPIAHIGYLTATLFLVMKRIAPLSKLVSTCLIAETQKPYWVLSQQRGISQYRLLTSYLFKNALIPVWIKAPKHFCHILFSACSAVEMLFSLKGFGYLSFIAMKQLDYPLILACVSISSMVISLAYILGDILQIYLTPSMRKS